MSESTLVEIIVGSETDLPATKGCKKVLDSLGIGWTQSVLSAHRHPKPLEERVNGAVLDGTKAVICFAGMSAALLGAVAAIAKSKGVMVIGVAVASTEFPNAIDALLAMTRLPPGLGAVCAGIGSAGGTNAALFVGESFAGSGLVPLDKLIKLHAEMNEAKPPKPGCERGPLAE